MESTTENHNWPKYREQLIVRCLSPMTQSHLRLRNMLKTVWKDEEPQDQRVCCDTVSPRSHTHDTVIIWMLKQDPDNDNAKRHAKVEDVNLKGSQP